MANNNEREKRAPILEALFYAAKGYVTDNMEEAFPPENEEMRSTWAQLSKTLEEVVPDQKRCEALMEAIIEYGCAVEWHFFKNGIRLAMQLMTEIHPFSFI